jgi:hypothetical protein
MQDANEWTPAEDCSNDVDTDVYAQPPAHFDPIVQDALRGSSDLDELIDETLEDLPDQTPADGPFAGLPGGVPGGSGTEELVGFINDGNTEVTKTINGFLDGDLTSGGDEPSSDTPWAPPLPGQPGLPEPSLPGPVESRDPIIHPEEFTLNGFPYQGQDPTKPGWWTPPTQ